MDMILSSLLLNVYMKPQGQIIDQFWVMYHPLWLSLSCYGNLDLVSRSYKDERKQT